MAGYSGRPLAVKLGIADGMVVGVLDAPASFDPHAVDGMPEGATVRTQARGQLDVIMSFHVRRAQMEARIPVLLRALEVDGGLWFCWPKKASGVTTDITEDTVREVCLPLGLVDNKVCAVDDIWSALRVVWRRELRAELRRKTGRQPDR
jgi:hypothetical protein